MIARLALAVAGGGTVVSLFAVVLALPFFRFGIWHQSEPVAVALQGVGGLVAIALAVLFYRRPQFGRLVLHPFTAVPLLLAVWSAAIGLVQKFPLYGWLGSPQVGEGVLWFLELAVLTAAVMVLRRFRRWRRLMLGAALVVVLGVYAIMAAWNETGTALAPYYFPDFVAFYALFFVPVMVVFAGRGRKGAGWALALAYLLAVVGAYISQNWTAFPLIVGLGPAVWAILRFAPLSRRWALGLAVAGTVMVPVVITGGLFVAPEVQEMAQEQSFAGRLANSVLSRYRLLTIVTEAVETTPGMVASGSGWGSYGDLFARYLPTEWAVLRDDPGKAALPRQFFWDAVMRVDFHSHNYLAEALLGGGVVAVLLMLAWTGVLPVGAARRHRPLAAAVGMVFGGIAAFWFQFAVTLPFMAAAWGSLAGRAPGVRLPRPAAPALLGIVGAVLLGWGVATTVFTVRAYYFLPEMQAPLVEDGQWRPCPETLDDLGRGGLHLSHRLRAYSGFMSRAMGKEESISDQQVDYLRGMICAAEAKLDEGAAFRLWVASVLARSDLAFVSVPAKAGPVVDAYLATWDERLRRALEKAPKRTDLAIPYLLWLLENGRGEALEDWAMRLYAERPADPVALWFSGIVLLNRPAQDQAMKGIERMQKALENGLERMMPVEEDLKRQVLG